MKENINPNIEIRYCNQQKSKILLTAEVEWFNFKRWYKFSHQDDRNINDIIEHFKSWVEWELFLIR